MRVQSRRYELIVFFFVVYLNYARIPPNRLDGLLFNAQFFTVLCFRLLNCRRYGTRVVTLVGGFHSLRFRINNLTLLKTRSGCGRAYTDRSTHLRTSIMKFIRRYNYSNQRIRTNTNVLSDGRNARANGQPSTRVVGRQVRIEGRGIRPETATHNKFRVNFNERRLNFC